MGKIFKKKTQEERELEALIKKIKSDPMNMSTLFDNLNMRSEIGALYSDLCRRVHPDRFIGNDEKMAQAENLFKQIQESKADYQRLMALKEEVDKMCER
jgi:hypothetical protein